MKQFWVPNRRKASSDRMGKFTIKKIRIQFQSSFFGKIYTFFLFSWSPRASRFSYLNFLIEKLYSLMKPNEQKNHFQESLAFFLASTMSFCNFN